MSDTNPATLPTSSSFIAYEDDHYNKGKSNKHSSTYDPNNHGGLLEKKSLDIDYTSDSDGNQDADYGSLQVGSAAWLMAYDGPNFTGSLKKYHNHNVYDLDDDTDGNGNDMTRMTGIDNDGNKNTSDWDNSIRSWRLSNSKLYDAQAMTYDFLTKYAPYNGASGGVADLDNKGVSTDFSNIPDATDWPYPATNNRAIDVYQGHNKYRIFWPFFIQSGTVMKVWLTIENQNAGDNEVAYVTYSLDLATGALVDDYNISYHYPTPPPVSDFWYTVAEDTVLFATAGILLAVDGAMEVFDEEDSSIATWSLTNAATNMVMATCQGNSLSNSAATVFDRSDSGAMHFTNIVAHAILRSSNAILAEVAQNCTSAESTLYGIRDSYDSLTLNMDSLATKMGADWDTSTWNANLQVSRGQNLDMPNFQDSTVFRTYMPEFTGMINKAGLFASCIMECMEWTGTSNNETQSNPHLSLSAGYDPTGKAFALRAMMNFHNVDYYTTQTGMITYNSSGDVVKITVDEDGVETITVADPGFNNDLIAFFISELKNQITITFPLTTQDYYYTDRLPSVVEDVINAIGESIDGI